MSVNIKKNDVTLASFFRRFATAPIAMRAAAALFPLAALAQTGASPSGTPPAPDASCTVIAFNRSAPLQSDYSFTKK